MDKIDNDDLREMEPGQIFNGSRDGLWNENWTNIVRDRANDGKNFWGRKDEEKLLFGNFYFKYAFRQNNKKGRPYKKVLLITIVEAIRHLNGDKDTCVFMHLSKDVLVSCFKKNWPKRHQE